VDRDAADDPGRSVSIARTVGEDCVSENLVTWWFAKVQFKWGSQGGE
jgi:hypothetical protein